MFYLEKNNTLLLYLLYFKKLSLVFDIDFDVKSPVLYTSNNLLSKYYWLVWGIQIINAIKIYNFWHDA